ncbi:hypothetical protein [Streptomyces mirabilis]
MKTGVTWAQLAEAVGKPSAWTTTALLSQHAAVPMDPTI